MLNERQKRFRKQMKQLERSKQIQTNTYSYREQRFMNEKPKNRFKKPLLQIGGTISLLVLLWNVYVFSSSIISGNGGSTLLSTNQLEVHQYIEDSSAIELALYETSTSLMNQYNDNTLTPLHIEEAQKDLFALQKRMDVEDSRFLLMNAYLDGQFKLVYQLTNVLKTRESDVKHAELTKIVDQQNVLLEKRNDALISVLDSEAIPYKLLEDGSISYQYEM